MGATATVRAAGHRICLIVIGLPRLLLRAEAVHLIFSQQGAADCLPGFGFGIIGSPCPCAYPDYRISLSIDGFDSLNVNDNIERKWIFLEHSNFNIMKGIRQIDHDRIEWLL